MDCLTAADCPEHYNCTGNRCLPPPLPGAPLSVHLIEARPRRIEVGWVYNGPVAATNWLVTAVSERHTAPPTSVPGSARAARIERARPDTTYTVCVRGTSLIGAEGPSACISVTTPIGVIPLPETAEILIPVIGRENLRRLSAASRGRPGQRPVKVPGLPAGVFRYMQNVMSGRSANVRAPSTLSPDGRRILDRSFRRGT